MDKKKRSLPSKKLLPNVLGAKRYIDAPRRDIMLLDVLSLRVLKKIPLIKNRKIC